MPTYPTPQPISVLVELAVGDVRIAASERDDTVVLVRPADPGREADVRAAERTLVELAGGGLVVRSPKRRGLFDRVGAVDVWIELPAGSALNVEGVMGSLRASGRLGACRVKSAMGDVELDRTGAADVASAMGSVTIAHVGGDADVKTASGLVHLREVAGSAVVKSANGDIRIGDVGGALRASSANGEVRVERAGGDVAVTSANGALRVGAVGGRSVTLKTACGEIEVGIPAGTAARLDVSTHFGRVRNSLEAADGPATSDGRVEVRARTAYGDIVIRRAEARASLGKALT